jgi:alginate O-acetyltransferase complex protein AlgI
MLFNSEIYILLFLPVAVIGYYILNRYRLTILAKVWLVLASFFFYGFWNPIYILLLASSILVNFSLGSTLLQMTRGKHERRPQVFKPRTILATGIIFNLALLGFFKYTDFLIDVYNDITSGQSPGLNLVLPLAISFFTFQQIAYLVDCFKSEAKEYDFLNYCIFVTFFPQLIAGPIVHHKEMMPQFARRRNAIVHWNNISLGLFVFFMGLFKKVIIADKFAEWANAGFDNDSLLTFFDAWGASLSYTLQLYYDFSAYTDMAIGAALLFNIRLPHNFFSPYKATSVQDFWRRWHITLSRWLRDYVYIPLGGNRRGPSRIYTNIFLTFLLGGIWHGAGWTFIIWGCLHGIALIVQKLWQLIGIRLYRPLAWFLTFMFVNASWVFFRAENTTSAINILRAMAGMNGIAVHEDYIEKFNRILPDSIDVALMSYGTIIPSKAITYILIFIVIALTMPNTVQISGLEKYSGIFRFRYHPLMLIIISFIASFSLLTMFSSGAEEFLYFNF